MGISSTGIGSGLDVENIVTKLVALEKAPLTSLKAKASSIQTQVSAFSQVKSLVSTFSDAVSKLTRDSAWSGLAVASTNAGAVSATVTGQAQPANFNAEVQQLARAHSAASSAIPVNAEIGSGTLTLQLGAWSDDGNGTKSFAAGSAGPVSITIDVGEGSLSSVAAKINDANAGVTATVLRDASGERLLLRAKDTGEAAGFRIQVADADGNGTDGAGLSRLAFDFAGSPSAGVGMAAQPHQLGLNTLATINGVPVTSPTSTLVDAIPGMTLQFSQVTTAPVNIAATIDEAGIKKNLQAVVDAFNAINTFLGDATKYDADKKSAGALQGDNTAVALLNQLRSMVVSPGGAGQMRLSDIGISMQRGGALALDATKVDTAIKDLPALKQMFAANATKPGAGGSPTDGLAVKLKAFVTGLLGAEGMVNNKADALTNATKRNTAEQDRVTERAAQVEKRLRAQYSALDTKMGSLTALNSYVTQQITLWNRSTS